MYRTIAVPFYQNAGIEGGLSSTASAKRTNSLETVAVGPVEAGRERGGGGGSISSCSCALSILDVSERTRCRTRISPIRILQHSHLPLRLYICIAVCSPTKANSVPGRADSQHPYAPRTSPPSPSTKNTAMNLNGHKRRESSPHFRRGDSPS